MQEAAVISVKLEGTAAWKKGVIKVNVKTGGGGG